MAHGLKKSNPKRKRFERLVQRFKRDKDVDNPFALAHFVQSRKRRRR